jgi:hypothetical protein
MSEWVLPLFLLLGLYTLVFFGILNTRRLFRPRLERNASRLLEELLAGEKVIASVNATLRVRRQDKVALHLGGNDVWYVRRYTGLLVITESRLIFAAKTLFLKRGDVEPLSEVSSLNLNPKFFNSQFQVIGPDWFINYVIKTREAEPFFATAQEVLARAHTSAPAPAAALSAADELAKLADLHRQGILNADEFAKAKARLLG